MTASTAAQADTIGASRIANRTYLIAGTLIYAVLYSEMYRAMADFWEYMGFAVFGYEKNWHYLGYIVLAVTSLFIRTDRKTPGEFVVNLIFYIVYIPSILTPLLQGRVGLSTAMASALMLGASFVFVTWFVHLAPTREKSARRVRPLLRGDHFLLLLSGMWAAANLYVVISLRDQLHFATIDEIYDQRFAFEAGGTLLVYVILNAVGAVNPMILALGLQRKSAVLVGMAVTSQAIMYSTMALKAVLASTLFSIAAFYFLMGRDGPKQGLIPLGLSIITAVGLALTPFYRGDTGLLGQGMSILFMRTLETPGMLYGIYLDFFSIDPGTAYSHVSVVKPFVTYPYGSLQVGQVIGFYANPEAGNYTYNTNANYLAADGLTAFGLWGIPVITVISAIFFRGLEWALRDTDKRLSCVALISTLFYLTNVSIFTTALTYGGILVVLLLWLATRTTIKLERPHWHIL
jgi:hypothetical protein